LKGACSGCPMSQMTIKNGIEEIMKKAIPEIKSVESVE
ncbi:MAG: NifU family protein, partial [Proteobacteria bacterium]|nr:NifU family protein [Pseudomonadota bacterium]